MTVSFSLCVPHLPPAPCKGDAAVQTELREEIEGLKAQLQASKNETQRLSDQNAELEQDVQRLQTETAQLQAMVRDFFHTKLSQSNLLLTFACQTYLMYARHTNAEREH